MCPPYFLDTLNGVTQIQIVFTVAHPLSVLLRDLGVHVDHVRQHNAHHLIVADDHAILTEDSANALQVVKVILNGLGVLEPANIELVLQEWYILAVGYLEVP